MRGESSLITGRIQPRDQLGQCWYDARPQRLNGRFPHGACHVFNSIDPTTTPFGSLTIRPVGNEQRSVTIHDSIGGFEAIRIVFRSCRKFEFAACGKAAARPSPSRGSAACCAA